MLPHRLLNGPFVTGPSVRQYTGSTHPRMIIVSILSARDRTASVRLIASTEIAAGSLQADGKVIILLRDISFVISQFILKNGE